MNVHDYNKYTLQTWYQKVYPSLTRSDRKSLQNTLCLISNYGDDFQNYRAKELRGIPNNVIYITCKFLKDIGYEIIVTREMSRYNLILTFCIQQKWKSCLEEVFSHIEFVPSKLFPKGQTVLEQVDIENSYHEILLSLQNGTGTSEITANVLKIESNLSYIAVINSSTVKGIITFNKKPLNKPSIICSICHGNFSFKNYSKSDKTDLSSGNQSEESAAPEKRELPAISFESEKLLPMFSPDPGCQQLEQFKFPSVCQLPLLSTIPKNRLLQ